MCPNFPLLKRTRRLKMDQTKDYLFACYDSIVVQFFGLSPIVVGLFIVAAALNDFHRRGNELFVLIDSWPSLLAATLCCPKFNDGLSSNENGLFFPAASAVIWETQTKWETPPLFVCCCGCWNTRTTSTQNGDCAPYYLPHHTHMHITHTHRLIR